jgi:hypothetical protein
MQTSITVIEVQHFQTALEAVLKDHPQPRGRWCR